MRKIRHRDKNIPAIHTMYSTCNTETCMLQQVHAYNTRVTQYYNTL